MTTDYPLLTLIGIISINFAIYYWYNNGSGLKKAANYLHHLAKNHRELIGIVDELRKV